MFFTLSKVLFFLIQPVVWLLTLLIWSFLTKSLQKRKWLLIASVFTLLIFSNQFLFNEVSKAWEGKIEASIRPNDRFEVAIVLGGISEYDQARNQQAFFANSERLLNILPLYQSGIIKKILFAGGSGRLTDDKVEAVSIRDYLISIGVRAQDILIETQSRNTYENAKYSIELMNKNNIRGKALLSTSATHMYRSLACFKKLGFEISPFPVDYVSQENSTLSVDYLFIPNPKIMDYWYWLFHEWVGIITYQLMGYC